MNALKQITLLLAGVFTLGTLSGCGDDSPWKCNDELKVKGLNLHEDYCLAFQVDIEAGSHAVNLLDEQTVTTYKQRDGSSWDADVFSYALDVESGLSGKQSVFAPHAQLTAGDMIFPGGYLAVSPAGTMAVGYTRFSDMYGQIMLSDGTHTSAIDAVGNWSVDFLDDHSVLVSGLGIGSNLMQDNAVYGVTLSDTLEAGSPKTVIGNVGDSSGPLSITQDIVVAGGWFGSLSDGENRLFGFSTAEVAEALNGSQVDAAEAGDLLLTTSSTFSLHVTDFGMALLYTQFNSETYAMEWTSLALHDLTVEGDRVTAGEEVQLAAATADSPQIVDISGRDDLLLLRIATDQGEQLVGIIAR